MGYIMDYIKNDVIEEKRLINSMTKTTYRCRVSKK